MNEFPIMIIHRGKRKIEARWNFVKTAKGIQMKEAIKEIKWDDCH